MLSIESYKIEKRVQSIFFRLAALKKSGEENWKRKVPPKMTEIAPPPQTHNTPQIEIAQEDILNDNNHDKDHDDKNGNEPEAVPLRKKSNIINNRYTTPHKI